MEIAATLATIDFALDKLKLLREITKKGADLEVKAAMLELQEALLSIKEENLGLKEKLSTLQRRIDDKDAIAFDGSVYWRVVGPRADDGPFCQRCYDVDDLLVRLQSDGEEPDVNASWFCTECEKWYRNKRRSR